MSDERREGLEQCLETIPRAPQSLPKTLEFVSQMRGLNPVLTVGELGEAITTSANFDPLTKTVRRRLIQWDHERDGDWTDGTDQNTPERRKATYRALQIDGRLTSIFDDRFPPYQSEDPKLLVAEAHEPWYQDGAASPTNFYWQAYSEYLRKDQNWPEESVQDLDEATSDLVERLSCPWRPEAYSARGLVVGYVQSGKTANFTGVLAKAADAGYRLFIILAGTVNLLRDQTQRRIDKELIGKELLEEDYIDDEEWDRFISHGRRPSEMGHFDWARLTGPQDDYKSLKRGIESLEFQKADNRKRFFEKENISAAPARIMVVKKIPSRLRAVAKDLGRIRAKLHDIPTLVIDDESDQASLNTLTPKEAAKERVKRTATNEAITDLLGQLSRAQYVGYTATPFANVFVDPDDEDDLFPRDFIIGLKRPKFYVGAADFHDLGERKPKGLLSNERAFVRKVKGEDEQEGNLREAIDSYLLAGAIKILRQDAHAAERLSFKHHTMLIHESQRKADHRELADSVERMLENGGYNAGGAKKRLRRLWETDFRPVSLVHAEDTESGKFYIPDNFEDVWEALGQVRARLNDGARRVLVVNSERDSDIPDFERRPVWKIIVGGTKLSRGYTVEGLTISYFRRRAGAADTLMQMGRWFGFRRGYRDLVRLYVGTDEPSGRGTINLYQAFEAVARDEIAFRSEVVRYAKGAEPPLTPRQVPPLVPAHMLMPTSKNKMFNARIVSENFGGRVVQSTTAPSRSTDVYSNLHSLAQLVTHTKLAAGHFQSHDSDEEFNGLWGKPDHDVVVEFLEQYKWALGPDGQSLKPLIRLVDFLKKGHGDHQIRDWLLLAPQLKGKKSTKVKVGSHEWTLVNRSRVAGGGRYQVYTDPDHVTVARYIAGHTEEPPVGGLVDQLRSTSTAVLLCYLVHDPIRDPEWIGDPEDEVVFASVGFAAVMPPNDITAPLRFGVVDKSRAGDIRVDCEVAK